jgi:hypothetical protein
MFKSLLKANRAQGQGAIALQAALARRKIHALPCFLFAHTHMFEYSREFYRNSSASSRRHHLRVSIGPLSRPSVLQSLCLFLPQHPLIPLPN